MNSQVVSHPSIIHKMSAMEIVQTMNYDDTNVAETLKRSLSEIAIALKWITDRPSSKRKA